MAALVRLDPGTVFARDFRVVRPLSEGGMGAVYVVEQLSTGKERALKIMLPQLVADPKARERFAQEARIGGQIKSDHIIEVVGAGIDDATGTPWLAMELLEGEDLAAVVKKRGALPRGEVGEIFEQLGDALGKAHALGVVHRDLKPENLFITASRRRQIAFTVKVLDFGIAKLVAETKTAATVTTAIGSPLWMAPEQAQRGAKVRPATDVWALGLIAFHLLTGRPYWLNANGDAEEFNLSALIVEVMAQPIDLASVRAAAVGSVGTLPAGFDAWFTRCVERDPEKRWRDANEAVPELLKLLPAVAAGGPVSLAPPTPVPEIASRPQAAPTALPMVQPQAPAYWGGTQVAPSPPPAAVRGQTEVMGGPPPGAARATPGTAGGSRRSLLVWGVPVVLVVGVGVWWAAASGRHREARPHDPAAPAPVATPVPVAQPQRTASCPTEMVYVPGGTVQSNAVGAFCLDRTEVTVAAYRTCSGCSAPATDENCNWNVAGREQHPVNCVDWGQAVAFCESRGGRLPTASEWQFAAQGSDGRTYPWGNAAPSEQVCWNRGPAGTCPVGNYPAGASPFGALDMAGNVWEWTSTVDGTLRVARGGGWTSDDPSSVRVAFSPSYAVSDRNTALGFRCARGVM